jgi:hypothetical protein
MPKILASRRLGFVLLALLATVLVAPVACSESAQQGQQSKWSAEVATCAPPDTELINCNDLIDSWTLNPEDYPDELWGASLYDSDEIDGNPDNEWFQYQQDLPTSCDGDDPSIVVGEINCHPPWTTDYDDINDGVVTFTITVDKSDVCCDSATAKTKRPRLHIAAVGPGGKQQPKVIKKQNRAADRDVPPEKPLEVPKGTRDLLPPRIRVPATKPVQRFGETRSSRASITATVARPALNRKVLQLPNQDVYLGTSNADFDLSGHTIEGTFYSGNGDVLHDGMPNYKWNRTQAESYASANTSLPDKKVAINIHDFQEFEFLVQVDAANRSDPTQVQVGNKIYNLNGLEPAQAQAFWEALSTAFSKTLRNYIERAGQPGTARCWLEGARQGKVFQQAEWPVLVQMWNETFADGPHKGERKLQISYFQNGVWNVFDGTNPPAFQP